MSLIRAKLKKAFGVLFFAGSVIEIVSGAITAYQVSGKTVAAMFIVAATAFVYFTARKTRIIPVRK
jgi:hypothetical protein